MRSSNENLNYKISFKDSIKRDLKNIPKKTVKDILSHIKNDLPQKAETLPHLKGPFKNLKRYRVGNYRVIFTIVRLKDNDSDESIILITRIADRKDVYK